MKSIFIFGGYGNFGKRIAESLLDLSNVKIIVAGRDKKKLQKFINNFSTKNKKRLEGVDVDYTSSQLPKILVRLSPDIVINTIGPYQGQSVKIAKACIKSNSHYIDLSDDAEYVKKITSLNKIARQKKLCMISGASSVPGLSSVILDDQVNKFSSIDTIDISIAPGNNVELGEATLSAILVFLGKSYPIFKDGSYTNTFGWTNPIRKYYGKDIGFRWLADVNVPDLLLFPKRYKVKKSVTFKAGIELTFIHFVTVFMAYMCKFKFIKNWLFFARPIYLLRNLFKRFGSTNGCMNITIKGFGHDKTQKKVDWTLYALDGVGPYIPTLSCLIMVEKILTNKFNIYGAFPCLGLYKQNDLQRYFKKYGLFVQESNV